ncbi:hypothetical protein [Flavobacterium sp. LAR06]|uniref:DUF7222 domain-containing protein n=1 Tax=Flavobacterium sp. LAR06 TaxID=3064897 RepID=UPI0035C1C199
MENLQHGGCINGMTGQLIHHSDCKEFYLNHPDDIEDIRKDLEDSIEKPIAERYESPTTLLCVGSVFEQYCFDIYRNNF